jgi:hypothetical protein
MGIKEQAKKEIGIILLADHYFWRRERVECLSNIGRKEHYQCHSTNSQVEEWLVDRLTQGQTLQEGPVTGRIWTTLIVRSANKDTLETTLFHLSDVLYAEGRVIDGETVNI